MANADNLPNPHFSKLEPSERFNIIRNTRALRRAVPEKKLKTTTAVKTARAKKKPVTGDLAGLSVEQLNMLMEMLNATN